MEKEYKWIMDKDGKITSEDGSVTITKLSKDKWNVFDLYDDVIKICGTKEAALDAGASKIWSNEVGDFVHLLRHVKFSHSVESEADK